MTENELLDSYLAYQPPPVEPPSARTWAKHIFFLVLTFFTATIAGSLYPFGPYNTLRLLGDDPETLSQFFQFLIALPTIYGALIGDAVKQLITAPTNLVHGISFSLSLLFILVCHEMGHYIACRIYRVDATLPFFIPTPPMLGPAGTFGAFIKILSPMPSRKAVFDIGVAGPIAGFIALLPIAVMGIVTMEMISPVEIANSQNLLVFSDPPLLKLLAFVLGVDLTLGAGNAFYYAAWVGLLVTALNLIPSGQLDGGHAIYAVLGEKVHLWTGRVAFVVMAVLSIAGLYFFSSPSGFLIAIILGVMMRIKHPQPYDQRPIGTGRKFMALLTVIIFILCFVPFPIRLS